MNLTKFLLAQSFPCNATNEQEENYGRIFTFNQRILRESERQPPNNNSSFLKEPVEPKKNIKICIMPQPIFSTQGANSFHLQQGSLI